VLCQSRRRSEVSRHLIDGTQSTCGYSLTSGLAGPCGRHSKPSKSCSGRVTRNFSEATSDSRNLDSLEGPLPPRRAAMARGPDHHRRASGSCRHLRPRNACQHDFTRGQSLHTRGRASAPGPAQQGAPSGDDAGIGEVIALIVRATGSNNLVPPGELPSSISGGCLTWRRFRSQVGLGAGRTDHEGRRP